MDEIVAGPGLIGSELMGYIVKAYVFFVFCYGRLLIWYFSISMFHLIV